MHLSVLPLAFAASGVVCYVSKLEWKHAPNHSNHSSKRTPTLKIQLYLASMYIQCFQASVIIIDLAKTTVPECSVGLNGAALNFYK